MAEPFSFIELVSKEELLRSADVISPAQPAGDLARAVGESETARHEAHRVFDERHRGGVDRSERRPGKSAGGRLERGGCCDVFKPRSQRRRINVVLRLRNFIATPHMAWYSEQASGTCALSLRRELVRAVKGEKHRYCLNGIS
jgi:D-3-phosphoglycerate dehydrogenase